MYCMSATRLEKLRKISPLVIGDIMLDRFIYGKVERISPEAPVPIFKYDHEKEMLGGAGNVVANITSLGCKCDFLGVIGNDAEGRKISSLLKKIGVHSHLLRLNDYPTIVKARLIAGNNHIVRVDHEMNLPIIANVLDRFESILSKAIRSADVVLLSDYNKGILTKETTQMIISICRRLNKPVIADPKGLDYSKYRGATLIKPNLKEFGEATGRKYSPKSATFHEEVTEGALRLMEEHDIDNLIVTLSEYGMLHISRSEKKVNHIFTEAREVYDVSGAGDTTLATLGMAIGSGMPIKDAMVLANRASGIVVGKLGTATVSFEELRAACSGNGRTGNWDSLLKDDELKTVIGRARAQNRTVKVVYGDFRKFGAAEIEKLNDIKSGCDSLFTVISGNGAECELARAVLCNHIAVDGVAVCADAEVWLKEHLAELKLQQGDIVALDSVI